MDYCTVICIEFINNISKLVRNMTNTVIDVLPLYLSMLAIPHIVISIIVAFVVYDYVDNIKFKSFGEIQNVAVSNCAGLKCDYVTCVTFTNMPWCVNSTIDVHASQSHIKCNQGYTMTSETERSTFDKAVDSYVDTTFYATLQCERGSEIKSIIALTDLVCITYEAWMCVLQIILCSITFLFMLNFYLDAFVQ